ncbi:HTTM domain-containing protein [Nocardia terpenica]|uniref:HTTM-like domain-containing protein n=1 Tax=Nocardia terpenica TaxID=455432 RepID=A0A291RF88_9NOCA|nr:HTTM domain-containing protein [Nocardia terpenica]ATL65979.1 hypothetical protein CRH09_06910 [Nocardia terpenica]
MITTGRHLLDRLATHRYHLYGSALVRIGIGTTILYICLANYAARHLFWGADNPWSPDLFRADTSRPIGLYTLASSGVWFEVLFHGQILLTLLYIVGYRGRIVAPLFCIATFALLQRNSLILSGGENLFMAITPFLAVLDGTRRLSLDRVIARRRGPRRVLRDSPLVVLGTVAHNAAVLAIAVQVCIVYFMAGMYKVAGPLWRSGEAVYYIMGVPLFGSSGVHAFLADHLLILSAVTYFTVVLQVGFPVLVLVRRTRPFVIAAAIAFHVGIAVVMALPQFALIMISAELIFCDDKHYRALSRLLRPRSAERSEMPEGGIPVS